MLLNVGGLPHFIGLRVGDEHVAHLDALAKASGFTRGEILRRLLLSTEIPSARARREVQDPSRFSARKTVSGAFSRKRSPNVRKRRRFVRRSRRSNATPSSSGAPSRTWFAPNDHHAEAAPQEQNRLPALATRPVHAEGQRQREMHVVHGRQSRGSRPTGRRGVGALGHGADPRRERPREEGQDLSRGDFISPKRPKAC